MKKRFKKLTEKRFIKFKIKKKKSKDSFMNVSFKESFSESFNELLAFLFILFFFVLAFYLGPAITGFTILTHTSSSDFTGTFNQTQTDGENVTINTTTDDSNTKLLLHFDGANGTNT